MRERTLSVCSLVSRPTARVAAQLGLLRDVADELVAAVDERVDERLLWPLQEICDTVVRFPYQGSADRPVAWLHSLCTCDWIFRLDDDEVVSAALCERLPDLRMTEGITHASVPRLWLYPTVDTYLDEPPWRAEDHQPRIVANDERLVWYTGLVHLPMQVIGPHRHLNAPIYHLDLLSAESERRAKARRYEDEVPGRRLVGLPFNAAFYLPELRRGVRTIDVPGEDAELLARLLGGPGWPEPRSPIRPLLRVTTADVDQHWRGRPAGEDLYQASIEMPNAVGPWLAAEEYDLDVIVRNDSPHVWPPGRVGVPEVRVTYRWCREEGGVEVAAGLRTPMPEAVPPGSVRLVVADVIAPPSAGRYVLEVDLEHEDVRRFGCESRVVVDVLPRQRIAVLGQDEVTALIGARAITEVLPWVEPVVLSDEPAALAKRTGYRSALGPRGWLLLPERGVRAKLGPVLRGFALLRDARRVRRGHEPRHVGPAGRELLDALAGVGGLLSAGDAVLRGSEGRREQAAHAFALRAARALGAAVQQSGSDEQDIRAAAIRLGRRLGAFVDTTN